MKAALIGEFSSLHRYLKEGMQELGVDVILCANGDGYKKIGGADIELPLIAGSDSFFQRLDILRDVKKIAGSFKNYDVVQLIHPNIFSTVQNTRIIKDLKNNNGLISLVSAGGDYALHRAYESGKYQYNLYNYVTPKMYDRKKLKGRLDIRSARKVEQMADIIIPAMYDYTTGYHTSKLHSIIPLPINVRSIAYRENNPGNKVIFFHGINREAEKGTPLIREALEKLQSEYPNDVEVLIDGRMPFDKYVKIMERVNVVVDQTYGYAYGINSCIALAQGKVVACSCKQIAIDKMGADSNPFVTIFPDVNDIYDKLCKILENRNKIIEMGEKGRRFVEKYHDHVMIAERYVEAWDGVKKE